MTDRQRFMVLLGVVFVAVLLVVVTHAPAWHPPPKVWHTPTRFQR